MSNYAAWRAVSTTLATKSEKWRLISNSARVLWLQIMLKCDNRGTLEGDAHVVWAQCSKRLGFTRAQSTAALGELVDADLIHTWKTDDNCEWVHLVGFDEHQPRDFLRRRGHIRSPEPPCMQGKTCEGRSKGRSKGRVQKKKEKENKKLGSKDPCEVTPTASEIERIFNHWVTIDADGDGSTRILNAARKQKIEARLAEGYSADDLCRAITAFVNDPWHRGENDRRKRFTGLVTLIKTGDKVEQGLRLAAKRNGAAEVKRHGSNGIMV